MIMWKNPSAAASAAAAATVSSCRRRGITECYRLLTPSSCWAARSSSSSKPPRGVIRHQFPTTASRRRQATTKKENKLMMMKSSSGYYYSTTTTTGKADASTMSSSSSSTVIRAELEDATIPTNTQLWRTFAKAAVPMIGFGFMDQTVMLQAGNVIDCTIGVTFGLSTLTAAAFGQICSDASGVIFGGTLDRLSTMAGLKSAGLSSAQRHLPIVRRTTFAGSIMGVIFGCCLGLLNLLFIDTNRSSTLKLQAFNEEQEFEFTIEASNARRKDVTALTVRGPDVDGLLASMTAALAVRGCSLVELHAKRSHTDLDHQEEEDEGDDSNPVDLTQDRQIEDIFYVVQRDTGGPFPDDELQELAQGLLDSTRTPMNVNSVKAAMHELESTNNFLQARIQKLEQAMYERQITVIPSSSPEGN